MPTSTTCPSCGHQMGLPGSVVGMVTCTACGQAFELPAPHPAARSSATKTALTAKTAIASPSAELATAPVPPPPPMVAPRPVAPVKPAPRPPGAPPELLDRLPKPFITSPPMIATGSVFVLLYGLVMIPVVSAIKYRPDPPPPPPIAYNTAPVVPILIPEPTKDTPDPKKTATDQAKKGEPGPEPPKSQSPDSPKNPKPEPAPPRNGKPPKPAPETSQTTVAMRTAPAALIPEAAGPKPEVWGVLRGFAGDCKFQIDNQGLTINVPGSLHILSPDPQMNHAPRLLTEAGGDFTAQVQVVGKLASGNVPLDMPIQAGMPKPKDKVPKLPFTFQGAGLLLSQDDKNFMRLERTASFDLVMGKKFHQVLFEIYRDGMSPGPLTLTARESNAITLKIEKTGSVMKCSYSPDNGKTWLDVKRMENVTLPETIKIGVSATNASTKTFEARFQNFELAAKAK